MKTTYLKADTITGVYEIDWSDLTETDEVTTPVMFQRCLKYLEDGEVLIAAFDNLSEEIYNEIKEEYHIN
jgi:hypothetical protein